MTFSLIIFHTLIPFPVHFRLTWIVVILLSFVLTAIMISETWGKFQDNPTVVTIQRNYMDWEVPVPALFMCPENGVHSVTMNSNIEK